MRRLLILPILLLLGAGSSEFEGSGEVQVVGTNVVSARRRALRSATQDAVRQAVIKLVGEQRWLLHEQPLRNTVLRRASRYMRRYRVLEEVQDGRTFRLRVAALLDLKRLQGDLGQVPGLSLDGPGPAPPADGQQPLVGLLVRQAAGMDSALNHTAVEVLKEAVDKLGFKARVLDGPPTKAKAAQAGAVLLVLEAAIQIKEARGIRGLGWPGAVAEVSLKLKQAGDGVLLMAGKSRGWGAAAVLQSAKKRALQDALSEALAPVNRALSARAVLLSGRAGQRIVHISGIASYRQYETINNVLEKRLPGIQRCRVRRIGANEAWFQVKTAHSSRGLGKLLSGHNFDSFSLKFKRIEGGAVWVIVALPPS